MLGYGEYKPSLTIIVALPVGVEAAHAGFPQIIVGWSAGKRLNPHLCSLLPPPPFLSSDGYV
eukprot:2335280-Pyramimonas_sp.AAC.1